ncbi:MAG: helix-turn-helix transcriptional regulator, partial [Clostridiaceae bacterium]|nr:helix-turn-helix transcriptional regulator [Clostridiaceae bacterium]
QYNFVEYVNLVRVNKAKELLMDSKFSIKDVSDKVGFINYNTFSRVFKKYAGVSAKQYRYEQGIKAGDDIQE